MASDLSPAKLIDERIASLKDWRGEMLTRVRMLIREADAAIVETWKWRGVPVWECDGMICTGESYKAVVKLTFAKGAALKDPERLFNASLDGNVRRAIDLRDGDTLDGAAFVALLKEAIALNRANAKAKSSRTKPATAKAATRKSRPALSGSRKQG